ncbi:MAG: toxin-antitoxin system YwqK family antitoxin, partial [Verrucomicrobiota bacterium]|nr:toxin-antitoxin system YwqK family antitoxin [Verrucomicrobiota bacterium]
ELTTVVTGNGQVATTALLSVKKTDKDNPSFKLPEGSEFISCRINGTTVTPGLENDNYIIPLPEEASRNQVFEVQISYSEKHDKFKHDEVLAKMQTGRLKLSGPVTLNIPNTYSRWTVYVPNTHELYGFEGNMVAPRKKQYTLTTAWERFSNFLRRTNWAGPILTSLIMIGLLAILIVYLGKGLRRALITTGAIAGIMILGGVVIALSMGGMAAAKYEYAAADSEYRSPAESVPGWYEGGEAEGERLGRSYLSSRESRDEAGAEESRLSDLASKTESPRGKSPKPDANKESQPGNSTTQPTPAKPGQDGLPKGTLGGAGGIGERGLGPATGGKTSDSSSRTRVSGKEEDSGRVTGVLPPEFVIPTDGRAYVFTKALNLAGKDENERLKIDANIMDWNSHRMRTGIFHWLVALAGLLVLVREYRQKERDSRWITAGLALILGGVGAFTCSQGALHLLFINALWVLALAIYAWAAWYFWPAQRYSPPSPSSDDKGDGSSSDEPDQPAKGSDGTSAATATAILFLLFSLNTALAADPVLPPPRDAKAWEGLENLLRLLADPDVLLQKPGGPKVIREAQLQDRNGTWFEINQENPFTGKVLGFFQNRQKRIESDYQDGLLHGVQTLWFDNGQKRQLTQHEKGLQHGVQTAWYRGGQKASESNYQKGKRQGSHSIWHPNGTLAGETSYLQGEPNGLARQWHNNGKIAREVRWERGRQLAFDTWTAKGVRFGEGTNTVSMVSASYQLNVHSEVAQVEAEFKLSARLTKQKFTLFREIIAVNEFSSVPAGAKLLREGPALVLYLPEAGEATVKMKFLTKHAGDATKRMLGFGIPSSLTSKVDVVLQEDDSEVEMPTAVTFSSSSGGNETLVEAVIGASDRLELTWKPRVKKAKEIAATVFVQNASTISFGNGVVQARTVLDYTVSQGELSEVKAVLPEGWKLMKVEGGKTMRTYFVNTEGDQSVLTAQLEKGVSTSYQLILEMEQTLAAPPTTVKLSMPRALGVKRETGFIALQSGEELGLTISESNGLLQVDGAEFTRNTKQKIQAGATSYGYNNPNYTLA